VTPEQRDGRGSETYLDAALEKQHCRGKEESWKRRRNAEAVGRVNKGEREREGEEARWRWRWRRKTRQEDCRSAGQDGLISAFRIRVVYCRGYYYFILLYYYI
jgi:hypothetical protein